MNNSTLNSKNWALFAVLLSIVIILFAVTIIRFAGAGTAG